jgi:hypothetical protein
MGRCLHSNAIGSHVSGLRSVPRGLERSFYVAFRGMTTAPFFSETKCIDACPTVLPLMGTLKEGGANAMTQSLEIQHPQATCLGECALRSQTEIDLAHTTFSTATKTA